MSQINDIVCQDKNLCDRVADTQNYRSAIIYAGSIDWIIPLLTFLVGSLLSLVTAIPIFPFSIILSIGASIFSSVFGAIVFIINIVLLILLFHEIGVPALIPLAGWGIGIILAITIIGAPLAIIFFFAPWSMIATAIRYYWMRPQVL